MLSYVTAQVSRRFKASPERLFDACINLEVWTHDAVDHPLREVRNDPRVGRTWYVKDIRDGMEFVADGEYLEVDRPRRFVYTFRMAQFSPTIDTITVEVATLDDGCEVTLTQEGPIPHDDNLSPEELAAMLADNKNQSEEGWRMGFEQIAAFVE